MNKILDFLNFSMVSASKISYDLPCKKTNNQVSMKLDPCIKPVAGADPDRITRLKAVKILSLLLFQTSKISRQII